MRRCATCGHEMAPKNQRAKYCGPNCRKGKAALRAVCCPGCDVVFWTTRLDKFFCTQPCANKSAGRVRHQARRMARRCSCYGCANLVIVCGDFARTCSDKCSVDHGVFTDRLKSRKKRQHKNPTRKACSSCGGDAGPYDGSNRLLCDPCRSGRAPRHYISPDVVRSVWLRDGARCHLCRKSVDLTLSGTLPEGPTIDHLVPISAGGTREPENLALAHRVCNVRRGNRGAAQLRLVG